MWDEQLADENVGWPSYVDFLSTFLFILILFVAWSVHLMAGVEREQQIQSELETIKNTLAKAGFEAVIEAHTVRIPLRNKVVFALNQSNLDNKSQAHLREAGKTIARFQNLGRIIVYGYADRVPPRHDPFFNWKVSVDRAESVLRFLYECSDCGYRPEDIRPKLVLRGNGDLDARFLERPEQQAGEAGDRRVDIILDKDQSN